MAVRNVVDHLADGPSPFAVRRIELRLAEPATAARNFAGVAAISSIALERSAALTSTGGWYFPMGKRGSMTNLLRPVTCFCSRTQFRVTGAARTVNGAQTQNCRQMAFGSKAQGESNVAIAGRIVPVRGRGESNREGKKRMHNVIIIGSGCAGLTAAIYAGARQSEARSCWMGMSPAANFR